MLQSKPFYCCNPAFPALAIGWPTEFFGARQSCRRKSQGHCVQRNALLFFGRRDSSPANRSGSWHPICPIHQRIGSSTNAGGPVGNARDTARSCVVPGSVDEQLPGARDVSAKRLKLFQPQISEGTMTDRRLNKFSPA